MATKKSTGGRTRGKQKARPLEGESWMNASPMAWVSGTLAVAGLCANIMTMGYIYARIEGNLDVNAKEIARNFKEDEARNERIIKSIDRLDGSLGGMGKLTVEIEVMKTQLSSINATLQRLELQLDRQNNRNNGR